MNKLSSYSSSTSSSNLIALTRWENAEPARPRLPPVPQVAANAVTKDQDLVETMRQSLADEQAGREQLARRLADADATLSSREQTLASLQAERARLAASLTDTENRGEPRTAAGHRRRGGLDDEGRLAQLQRDLEEKTAEAEREKQSLASLAKEQAEAKRQIEGLTMAVVVAEADKQNLRKQADELEGQVRAERAERASVELSNTQLAQGVGQLAQKSGELTSEIRDNRPVNANVLFNDFLRNRVNASFSATRNGLFGPFAVNRSIPTVFTTDGRRVFALVHAEDTIFSLESPGDDWAQVGVAFDRPPSYHTSAASVEFLALDPRVIVVPVSPEQAAALGAKVYPIAREPFKFPEAVLINATGKGYGTVGFKLDPERPGYVRVDNRLFKRIFGDFAPSRGDIVFSQTGDLLGIMVNSDYCALIGNFSPAATLPTGDATPKHTGRIIDALAAQIRRLPLQLQ